MYKTIKGILAIASIHLEWHNLELVSKVGLGGIYQEVRANWLLVYVLDEMCIKSIVHSILDVKESEGELPVHKVVTLVVMKNELLNANF